MVLFYCLLYVRSFLIQLFATENTTGWEEPWPRGPPLDPPPDLGMCLRSATVHFPILEPSLIYKVYGLVSSKAEKFT